MMAYNNSNTPLAPGCTVYIQDGKFEAGLRKFKNKVQDSGLLIELKEREAYEKPTTKRKRAAAQARKRWLKKLSNDTLPKKYF
jgi:small subunit ribosomal protein S21